MAVKSEVEESAHFLLLRQYTITAAFPIVKYNVLIFYIYSEVTLYNSHSVYTQDFRP